MKQVTKEQVLDAAGTSKDARRALEKLFPEAFERKIQVGEIYGWGTSNDNRGSGMVMQNPEEICFIFINFHTSNLLTD